MGDCFRLFSLCVYLVSESRGHYTHDSMHESPIRITTAGEFLKSLTFYNDIKCITDNKYDHLCGANLICYVMNIDFTPKLLGSA